MFWYTARDDLMFNMIRVISRHHDIQIYGAILPDELTNQEMLDSKAYKKYYDVASGAEPLKAKTKYKNKADKPITPSRSKSAAAAKSTRLKTLVKVTRSGKKRRSTLVPKAKRLAILFEVALSEAKQIKLATKRSKNDFYMSHTSDSGDGVNIQSKVPNKQQQRVTSTNEGAVVRLEVPDVPKYNSESKEESWTFSQNDEDDVEELDMNDDSKEIESDNDGYDLTHPNLSTYKADDEEEEEKGDDDEVSSDQRVYTPLDHQLTIEEENQEGDDELQRNDVEMTNAQQEDVQINQVMKDNHVTLTTVPLAVQHQSSHVSSDLVSKFIKTSPDTGIVDNYFASKMKKAVDVAVQLQINKFQEEAQAKNQVFLHQVDLTMKAIIKEQVQAHVSKIILMIKNHSHLVQSSPAFAYQAHRRQISLHQREECVEDLQLGVESYQKKINLTRRNTYRLDLRIMTPYTTYPDIQGIIYEDEMNRNRLMCTDELHKYSDGTLNHIRITLNDIATGIEMDYFPKIK
nr:hypothetical protein [Tanacetum cinerariifolium]